MIWQATAGDTSAKNKKYIKSHDSLYFYSKGFEKIWNDVYQPYDEGGLAPYKYQDEMVVINGEIALILAEEDTFMI